MFWNPLYGKPKHEYRVRLNPYHPLNQGLVAWWMLNEGAGAKAYNIVNSVPSAIGSATTRALGRPGAGISFSNTANSQITTVENFAGRAAFTFHCTVRIISIASYNFFYGQWVSNKNVLIRANGADVQFYTYTTGQVGGNVNLTVAANNMYDLAFTYDGAKMYGYSNGAVGSTSYDQTGVINTSADAAYIGRYSSSYSIGFVVFDAQIYSRALSQSEIQLLHNNLFGTIKTPRLFVEPSGTWFIPVTAGGGPSIPVVMADDITRRFIKL